MKLYNWLFGIEFETDEYISKIIHIDAELIIMLKYMYIYEIGTNIWPRNTHTHTYDFTFI